MGQAAFLRCVKWENLPPGFVPLWTGTRSGDPFRLAAGRIGCFAAFQKLFQKNLKKGLHFSKECGIIIELSSETANTVGVDCREGPPVPIPNTEVKLAGAEDTWLVTARKNRFSPTQNETTRSLRVVFLYPVTWTGQATLLPQVKWKTQPPGFAALWTEIRPGDLF